MSLPVITFTTSDRPQYLREMLESWSKVEGVGRYRMIANCEPGYRRNDSEYHLGTSAFDECIQMCQEIDFAEVDVRVNTGHYGGPTNQWMAHRRASETDAEWWVIAEEDVIVAPDILDMFETMARRYRGRKDIAWMCATTHRFENGPQPPSPKGLFHGVVTTLVWAIWRDRWPLLDEHWDFEYRLPEHVDGGGWDWNFYGHVMPVHNVHAIKPSYSRTKHIGVTGNHSTEEIYPQTLTDCFIGDFPEADLSRPWRADREFREQWD